MKSAASFSSRPTFTAMSQESRHEFVDYNFLDTSRKEIIHKEQEARRAWTAKFDPWLIEEYRQVRFSFP